MKKCPYCAEEIQDAAIKCRHCSSSLDTLTSPKTSIDEQQLLLTHPSWMSYFGNFFLATVLLLLALAHWSFLLLSIAVAWWAILDRNRTVYTVTSKRVLTRQGVFSTRHDEIDIKDIRNITAHQSIGQSFIQTGDVLIGTAGTSGYEIVLRNINNYKTTADLIRSRK